MRIDFRLLCWCASALLLCTSCIKGSNDEVVTYDDAAIKTFVLGTLKQNLHTTSSTGADSVYTKSIDCSAYTFCIDQLERKIYNPDSLPMGTDASRVVCTIGTLNSGVVVVERMGTDDTDKVYSSADSIDFSQPRVLRVYSTDGTAVNSYTVQINVHKEDGDAFSWTAMGPVSELTAYTSARLLPLDGTLYAAVADASATQLLSTTDGQTWQTIASGAAGSFAADAYGNTAVHDGRLYLLDNGTLYSSPDGGQWTQTGTASLQQLVGAATTQLYALDDESQMVFSTDGGQTWTADVLDADAAQLPTENVACASYAYRSNSQTDYVLLAGNRPAATYPADKGARLWHKYVDYSTTGNAGQWAYMEWENRNYRYLPLIDGLSLVHYNGSVLAFGQLDGNAVAYESQDNGLTWTASTQFALPETLDGSQPFAVAADAANFLWVVQPATGSVWRGRLNALGW